MTNGKNKTTARTILSGTFTCQDTALPIKYNPLFFHTGNFHVIDQDVNYGDGTNMDAIGEATAVISLDKGNLADLFFKNKTAGQTAKIYYVCTVDKIDTGLD